MLTREEAYKIVFENQKAALSKKQAEYDNAVSELCIEEPRLNEINQIMKIAGSRLAIATLSGKKKEIAALRKEIAALAAEKKKIYKAAKIRDIEYFCPYCCDSGYINGKICDCVHSAVKRLTIDNIKRELPLDSCSFKSFDLSFYPDKDINGENPYRRMSKTLERAKEYVASFSSEKSESLLFMGNAGLGKTHISLSITSELINKGFDVIYGSAYNLFSSMEEEHFNRHIKDSYEAATRCDLLVIDDLGSEFVTPFIQTILYNLVNTRILNGKPTIISTNLSMAEISDRYTPRVASRFIGSYSSIRFLGKDIRQQMAIRNANFID